MSCKYVLPSSVQVDAMLAEIPNRVLDRLGIPPLRRRLNLDHLAPRPPKLDAALLPEPLRAWIQDAADSLGVPIAAVAGAVLVAAAATIGTTAKIQVLALDPSWLEPCILRGMLIGASGAKKSPAVNAALDPLTQIERTKRAEFEAGAHKRNAKLAILTRDINKIGKGSRGVGAAKTTPSSEEARLEALLEEQAGVPLEPPRTLANDATVERLGTLIHANPRGILLYRDELEGLLSSMQRDGHQNDRSFFLESYNPNATYTFDRIGRGTTTIDPLALSMYGEIQPSVLAKHIASLDRNAGGDGFFARFQLVTLLDVHDVRSAANRRRDDVAFSRAMAVFRSLDETALAAIKDEPRGYHRTIRFATDAQQHFDEWRIRLEERVRALGESALSSYTVKTPAAGARMALIVHLLERAGGDLATEVTLDQAKRATGLMDHFAAHAEVLYAREQHPHTRLARSIAAKIDGETVTDGMTVTDVGNLFDSKARGSMDEVRAALDLLAELNWLRVEEHSTPRARSTFVVRLIDPQGPTLGADAPLTS